MDLNTPDSRESLRVIDAAQCSLLSVAISAKASILQANDRMFCLEIGSNPAIPDVNTHDSRESTDLTKQVWFE